MHLGVELGRRADGRLEGTVVTPTGDRYPFAGTLDLLRVLEGLPPAPEDADPPRPGTPGTGTR